MSDMRHLPLQELGLKNSPAIPYIMNPLPLLKTAGELGFRTLQTIPAKKALSNTFTIGGHTATGYEFLFGGLPPSNTFATAVEALGAAPFRHMDATFRALCNARQAAVAVPPHHNPGELTALSLNEPRQFALSLTNFENIAQKAAPLLADWTASMADPDAATKQFWPTIAGCGVAYNLLMLERVDAARAASLQALLGAAWTADIAAAGDAGRLYVIDLSIFASLQPHTIDGFPRFTPGTITLLMQDATTRTLNPVAVSVSSSSRSQLYVRGACSGSAWLYALQAAKVSVTVYGIWLGHVYHWHIVTAAMQMTMFNNLKGDDPVHQLLSPLSADLIEFDEILLLLWSTIAPPTSISSVRQFLELTNTFAAGRKFFDDDPKNTLLAQGLDSSAFTSEGGAPWDLYPAIQILLRIWNICAPFVDAVVDGSYASDAAVVADKRLQKWIAASGDPAEGNIRGLPPMNSREALKTVLTSLVYRIVAHGISRINRAANPPLTFVANFPPCLQKTDLPGSQADLSTAELLAYLPVTGTVGKMIAFYFIFVFSKPFSPLIPEDGIDDHLYFPGGHLDPRNQALVAFRRAMVEFQSAYDPDESPHQWPETIDT